MPFNLQGHYPPFHLCSSHHGDDCNLQDSKKGLFMRTEGKSLVVSRWFLVNTSICTLTQRHVREVCKTKDTEDHSPAPPSALKQVWLVQHSSFHGRPYAGLLSPKQGNNIGPDQIFFFNSAYSEGTGKEIWSLHSMLAHLFPIPSLPWILLSARYL